MAGLLPLLLLLLPADPSWGSKDKCSTKMYTLSGECCRACNLGEGVVQPCGVNQTVCEPCLDSVTFSDTVSATEPCKPCTQCLGLQSMSAPCVESDDAVCHCSYGYFQDEASGACRECRVCGVGFGLMFPCKDSQDTVCEECPEGTFSSEANFVDPCLPCTTCEDNEVLVKECTPVSDAECRGLHPRWTTPPPSLVGFESPEPSTREPLSPEGVPSTPADTGTTVVGSSQPVVSRGTADNLIPVYCSILAAVVVGLVAYIAFKRWNNCKQNKQGANNRPVNQTPSPEGEKLHSDSGISVDSQSLHDQQPPGQGTQGPAPKADGTLYASLPPGKQEEVEKLLGSSAEEPWRQLAGELGYKDELIDSFTREESPARALLAHWSSKDSATLEALLAALRRIQRGDIADSLASESTATSPRAPPVGSSESTEGTEGTGSSELPGSVPAPPATAAPRQPLRGFIGGAQPLSTPKSRLQPPEAVWRLDGRTDGHRRGQQAPSPLLSAPFQPFLLRAPSSWGSKFSSGLQVLLFLLGPASLSCSPKIQFPPQTAGEGQGWRELGLL